MAQASKRTSATRFTKSKKKNTKLIAGKRWPKRNILIFVLLFAAVAGYIIYRSFAASSTALLANDLVLSASHNATTVAGSGSKKNATVVLLQGGNSSAYLRNTERNLDAGIYKACLYAVVPSGTASGTISIGGATVANPNYSQSASQSTDYSRDIACITNVQVASATSSLQATVTDSGSAIRFGSIIFTKTGDLPPTPPPSCTKTINPGTSVSTTFNSLSAGQTLCLHGGTYKEIVTLNKSGTSNSPLTIRNVPGETAVIDGSGLAVREGLFQIAVNVHNVVVDGLIVQNSSRFGIENQSHHNTIRNCIIKNTHNSGLETSNLGEGTEMDFNVYDSNEITNTVLQNVNDAMGGGGWDSAINNYGGGAGGHNLYVNNYVHDNWGEGMTFYDNDIARGNKFKDNWSVNMYVDGKQGVLIEKNIAWDTEGSAQIRAGRRAIGIGFADEDSPARSRNNTVRNNILVNTSTGINFWNSGSSGTGLINDTIDNNTIVYARSAGIGFDGGSHSGTVVRDNLSVGPRPGGVSSSGISAAANLFTSSIGLPGESTLSGNPNDYRLPASATAAINKGVTTSATDDFFGTARPQGSAYDIGAIEL